jgi:pimeloyl-ACP methyl ester carboxylesterase
MFYPVNCLNMRKNIFISVFLFLLVIFSQNKRFGEAAGQTPNTSTGAQSVSRSRLKPCQVPNLKEEVFCGTYEVYENRVARKGRKISLNIVLLPALTSNPTPDPLFPIAGGPGQSATAGAANDAQRFAQIRRQRDIVLVDQRGTGKSNPLDCDFRNPNEALRAFVIGDIPVGQVKQCRQKLEKTADLRFYTTPIAMDDLDEVRNWLGYEQINVYGGSYGTRAALVYLKRHPKQVRTVTLRAVSSTYEKNPLHNPRDSQLSLDRLFEDCAKDEGCAKAFPNLSRNFQIALEQLAQSPAKVSVKNPQNGQMFEIEITRELFAGTIRRLLYDSGSQRIIPLIIKSALNKDFSQTTAIFSQTLGLVNSLNLGQNLSVNCAEDVSLISEKDIARETKGTFIGSMIVRSLVNVCQEWSTGKLPRGYHRPIKSDAPVLLFSGVLDPQSPPRRGIEVSRYLPNSLHIIMDGVAHAPFPGCALNIMSEFILKGSTKELDLSCNKELRRPPFVLPPSR